MKKILRWLLWIPLGALLVVFLVANRRMTALSLDPVSIDAPALTTPAAPLWFWLVLFLLAGVGLGGAGMWFSGREMRIRARADRLELKVLKDTAAANVTASPPAKTESREP